MTFNSFGITSRYSMGKYSYLTIRTMIYFEEYLTCESKTSNFSFPVLYVDLNILYSSSELILGPASWRKLNILVVPPYSAPGFNSYSKYKYVGSFLTVAS